MTARAFVTLAGAACAATAAHAGPIIAHWQGASFGAWTDASRWSTPGFPNNTQTDVYRAVVDAQGVFPYSVILAQSVALDALEVSANATVRVQNATMELLTGAELNAGALLLENSTILGGVIDQSGGSFRVANASVNVLDGATVLGDLHLDLSGALRLRNGAGFTGNMVFSAANSRVFLEESFALSGREIAFEAFGFPTTDVVLENGATLTIETDGVVSGGNAMITGGQGAQTINRGLLSADRANTRVTLSTDGFINESSGVAEARSGGILRLDTDWANHGLIRTVGGTLELTRAGSNLGQIVMDANSTLQLLDAEFKSDDLGFGTPSMSLNGADVELTGVLDNTNQALDLSDGQWTINGGVVRNGSILDPGATLQFGQSGATFEGVHFVGDLAVGPLRSLTLRDGATINGHTTAVNGGRIVLDDASIASSLTLDRGVLTTTPGSIGEIAAGVVVALDYGVIGDTETDSQQVHIRNAGEIRTVSGATAHITANVFENLSGGVVVADYHYQRIAMGSASGFIWNNHAGATISSGGRLDIVGDGHNAGLLDLIGKITTINGSIDNSGKILIHDGLVLINGSFSNSGEIHLERGELRLDIDTTTDDLGLERITSTLAGEITITGSIDNEFRVLTPGEGPRPITMTPDLLITGGRISNTGRGFFFDGTTLDGVLFQGDISLGVNEHVLISNSNVLTGDEIYLEGGRLTFLDDLELDHLDVIAIGGGLGPASSATLTIGSECVITGTGFGVGGDGDVRNMGLIEIDGGSGRMTAGFVNEDGGVVELRGDASVSVNRIGQTEKRWTNTLGGYVQVSDSTSVDFYASAINDGVMTIADYSHVDFERDLENRGVITVSKSILEIDTATNEGLLTAIGDSTVEIDELDNSGRIESRNGATVTIGVLNDSGGEVYVHNAQLRIATPGPTTTAALGLASVSGTGADVVISGNVDNTNAQFLFAPGFEGAVTFEDSVITGGEVHSDPDGVVYRWDDSTASGVRITGGVVQEHSASLTLQDGATIEGGVALKNNASLTIRDTASFDGGLSLGIASSLIFDTDADVLLDNVAISGDGYVSSTTNIRTDEGRALTLGPGVTFESSQRLYFNTGRLINNGVFNLRAGEALIGSHLQQNREMINNGEMSIREGGHLRAPRVTNNGVLRLSSDASLYVSLFTQSDAGSLIVDVTAPTAGLRHPELPVFPAILNSVGIASLGGSLQIELGDGYIPMWRDQWQLLDSHSPNRGGSFSSVDFAELADPTLRWWIFENNFGDIFFGVRHIADVVRNGVIDFADLNAVLAQFGQSGADLVGDANTDGVVDFADVNTILVYFGLAAPTRAIPAPSAAALIALAALTPARRRRREMI